MSSRIIRIDSEPYQPFLDRAELPQKVAAGYAEQLWLLREIASYGSSLIRRCVDDREGVDLLGAVVLLSLAKQVVAMVDGCEILLSQSGVLAAFLQARALLESSVSIDWILARDSDVRARAYYVGDLRNQLAWADGVIPGTAQYQRLEESRATIEGMNITAGTVAAIETEARAQRRRIQNHLRRPALAPTNAAYEQHKGKRHYDPPWHKVVGASSVREMARQVCRVAEYDYFYTVASQVMHGSSYRQHFRVLSGKAIASNVRAPEGIDTLLRIVIATTSHTYRSILHRYRPDEEPQYAKKYAEEWRGPFMSIRPPSVEFRRQ